MKTTEEEERFKVPRVSIDYFFVSQTAEEAKQNPVLVAINEATGDKHARAAGRKGIENQGDAVVSQRFCCISNDPGDTKGDKEKNKSLNVAVSGTFNHSETQSQSSMADKS